MIAALCFAAFIALNVALCRQGKSRQDARRVLSGDRVLKINNERNG